MGISAQTAKARRAVYLRVVIACGAMGIAVLVVAVVAVARGASAGLVALVVGVPLVGLAAITGWGLWWTRRTYQDGSVLVRVATADKAAKKRLSRYLRRGELPEDADEREQVVAVARRMARLLWAFGCAVLLFLVGMALRLADVLIGDEPVDWFNVALSVASISFYVSWIVLFGIPARRIVRQADAE